ncbi:MAG: hypothetical protein KatS3mg060_1340 [Dehalococcoidia bacterium]|nr:MAG: hypothetical protein KatS3mg060_1340 [Dehalococcoidia bacterium]
MQTIRRIYLYVVSAVSLGMLAAGVVELARTLVAMVVPTAIPANWLAENLAAAVGTTIVALPVWLFHWGLANRLAARDATERVAALRRLYLYGVLAVSAIFIAIGVSDATEALTAFAAHTRNVTVMQVIDPLPVIVVTLAVWWYHWGIAGQERRAFGEGGASATIRRWYVYGSAFWALVVLLPATTSLVRTNYDHIVGPPTFGAAWQVSESVGPALAGLLIWAAHWIWSSRGQIAEDDRRSVLRAVYLLSVIAIALTVTLVQAGQVLFYLLSRLLGVPNPGGQTGSIAQLLAGPVAAAIVYGAAWWYHQRVLRGESAVAGEAPRRLGVRRLYRYLIALVALALLSVGLAGVLWTIGDLLSSGTGQAGFSWQEQISLFATLAIVGLPVWIAVWRPRPDVAEAASLSRRLYLYLALIGSVLAALISGAVMAFQAIALVIGARSPTEAVNDLTRALAVVLVGAGVAVYQWRALQLDASRAGALPRTAESRARLRLIGPDGRIVRELAGEMATLELAFDRLAGELETAGLPRSEPS